MLSKLKEAMVDVFGTAAEAEEVDQTHILQVSAAALLFEVAFIDEHLDETEIAKITEVVQTQYQLSQEELTTLLEKAKHDRHSTTSLYKYTRLINDNLDAGEKFQLVIQLWQVAYADGILDKYEEHLIRRLSDLIHVPHSEFIRAKHVVKNERAH